MPLHLQGTFHGHVGHGLELRSAFQQRGQFAVASAQHLLPLHEFGDLVLHDMLVKHLPAGDPVDLGAESRNPIFVKLFVARLTRDAGVHEIVAKHEIGGCPEITGREREEGRTAKRHHPWAEHEMADFIAASRITTGGSLCSPDTLCFDILACFSVMPAAWPL